MPLVVLLCTLAAVLVAVVAAAVDDVGPLPLLPFAAVAGVLLGVLAARRGATPREAGRGVALALLLTARGLLLWVVIPLGLVLWPAAWAAHLVLGKRRPRPSWVVTWLDGVVTTGLNVLAGRPLDLQRPRWGEPPRRRTRLTDLA